MPEVNSSIEKASRAFVSQRISTFYNPNLSISTKRAVYKAVILVVLLYTNECCMSSTTAV